MPVHKLRAMILAAGRGERMRPLTDHWPKPLLKVGAKPLLEWHVQRLAAAGVSELVINVAYLGEKIIEYFGDGAAWGVHIRYSPEPVGALETAGGIRQALPLLGDAPFLVINGDIWCDWDVRRAVNIAQDMQSGHGVSPAAPLAHLVLVPNPPQHPQGDFVLEKDCVTEGAADVTLQKFTFAGIGVYQPQMFAPLAMGQRAALAPLLRAAMTARAVRGEKHEGVWHDVGTPKRWAALDHYLQQQERL